MACICSLAVVTIDADARTNAYERVIFCGFMEYSERLARNNVMLALHNGRAELPLHSLKIVRIKSD